jgi:two-component system, NarL family, response regulator DevR
MPMDEIKVGIVDDHSILRQGLRAMLDLEPGMRVVGDAGTERSAITMVAQARPDVVLIDLKLTIDGGREGLDLCAKVTGSFPESRILVLTTFADEWLVRESIRQGAQGYVVKDVDLSELIRAIRTIYRGESAFDTHSASAVMNWLRREPETEATSHITPREREILPMLAQGLSNVTIGKRLDISDTTVKFHVTNLMHKLGARRRAEAVYVASKLGLI